MAGYALLQLLTICQNSAAIAVAKTPWRSPDTVTLNSAVERFRATSKQGNFPQESLTNPLH